MRKIYRLLRDFDVTKAMIVLALTITFLSALAPVWRLGSETQRTYLLRLAEEEQGQEDTAIRLAAL